MLRRRPDHQPQARAQPGDRRDGDGHRHGAARGTQLDYRDGRIVNANMSDYLVPVNADVPALDAAFLPAEDTVADPIGVKGLGELVIVAVPPAIANAVFNATGRRVTDLPMTIEKLL
jgi:xanthine dehydrogenase YagR molybdenum-binding subunit